jgi:tripartite ATP-independent transporter DctM subunit
LTRLFSALVGWIPGGTALAITLVLALFTPLTGASGVTILSMGGLFLPVLLKAGYPYKTSVGLITVAGSIGLLFFPSLPVFLYAFKAEQPYEDLFVGGFLPGILLVLVVGGWAALRGYLSGATKTTFRAGEAVGALWGAKWELLLPVILLACFVGGYATLVEIAALTVFLTVVIECLIHKDLRIWSDLPCVFVECATLIGGFMIILCVALGFTNYLIIAEVPDLALSWVQTHIQNPLVFLLALNLLLIIVGALMDIYSAIIVVVPLITPMAAAYGIHPIHLGIIFLANMELGYLMPPMGENLFLSAYRFEQSLTRVYRSTLPYVLILAITVLAITYLPIMTLGLVEWLHN